MGRTIFKKTPGVPHPSILAASSISLGHPINIGRRTKTEKGMVMVLTDIIGAAYVFRRFNLVKVKNIGVRASEAGIIWVMRKSIIISFLHGSLYRESP